MPRMPAYSRIRRGTYSFYSTRTGTKVSIPTVAYRINRTRVIGSIDLREFYRRLPK